MTIDFEKRIETCDFWIGFFPDEDAFSEYVGEDPGYYQREEDDPQKILSRFAGDQGETWYDHDMIEMGFNAQATTVAQLVEPHSYADQYVEELSRLARDTGLPRVNAFLFIRAGEIAKPRSVRSDTFDFRYVGAITYRI